MTFFQQQHEWLALEAEVERLKAALAAREEEVALVISAWEAYAHQEDEGNRKEYWRRWHAVDDAVAALAAPPPGDGAETTDAWAAGECLYTATLAYLNGGGRGRDALWNVMNEWLRRYRRATDEKETTVPLTGQKDIPDDIADIIDAAWQIPPGAQERIRARFLALLAEEEPDHPWVLRSRPSPPPGDGAGGGEA